MDSICYLICYPSHPSDPLTFYFSWMWNAQIHPDYCNYFFKVTVIDTTLKLNFKPVGFILLIGNICFKMDGFTIFGCIN
jgi:hypothetical protein